MWRSLPGCFIFGAFGARMLLLRSERLPPTSTLWLFRTFGVTT